MAKHEAMLTTTDNPYDPFTEFDKWYSFDVFHGYNCCSLLGVFANTSNEFSDSYNDETIEQAIDEIVANDPLGIYIKAEQDVE